MSFKEIQKEKTAQIEQILKAYLPRVQGYQEVIMDAMSYSMLAGGKRLRPMLMQATHLKESSISCKEGEVSASYRRLRPMIV